ncbi:unnamed protein product, partial [marine sediment metagenome]
MHSRRRLVDIKFSFEEGHTLQAEGALGYQGEAQNEQNPWAGSLTLEARNIRGTGRNGALRFEQEALYTFLKLMYLEPWIAGQHLDLGGFLETEIEKESFARREIQLELAYHLSGQWTSSATVGQQESTDEPSAIFSKTYSVGLGLEWNSMDNPSNPRNGFRFIGKIVGHRKRKAGRLYY